MQLQVNHFVSKFSNLFDFIDVIFFLNEEGERESHSNTDEWVCNVSQYVQMHKTNSIQFV